MPLDSVSGPRACPNSFFNELLDYVDSENAISFASNFTKGGKFTWGNFPTLIGRTAIAEFTQGFFSKIFSVRHDLDDYCQQGEYLAMTRGRVTFTLLDGSVVTVPFATVSQCPPDDDTLLDDYQVYLDPSPLVGVTVPA